MKVELAKTAGFCFGVNRAVELVYNLISEGEKVCTLGPIIHNPIVVNDLSSKGVRIVEDVSQVHSDEVLVIRSHGVERSVIDEIKSRGIKYKDATCPYVSKIHRIAASAGEKDATLIIIGDENHPEVIGIKGHAKGEVFVVADSNDLEKLLENNSYLAKKRVFLVAQTTFSLKEWKKSLSVIKKLYTNAEIFDTICRATEERQKEAALLSERCDLMLIIGGKQSSNTAKLMETSKQNCEKTFLVEQIDELPLEDMKKADFIGVTAGASTPVGIIKEVLKICQNL